MPITTAQMTAATKKRFCLPLILPNMRLLRVFLSLFAAAGAAPGLVSVSELVP
jgi:hypothetical protein